MQTLIPLADDFNLEKILKYKPFFFFFGTNSERTIIHKGEPLRLSFTQKHNSLVIEFNREINSLEQKQIADRISFGLGAQEVLSEFYGIAKNDKVLKNFSDVIYGNRLLSAYDDFEALVSIIASQNVTFAQYKKMVGKIVDAFGGGEYFPTALEVLQKKELLKECGLGYRTEFIENIAEHMRFRNCADLDTLHTVKGIGPYSLDIFRLFQLRDYNAFYVDVLIKKIFRENYGFEWEIDKDVREFAKMKFGKFQGLAEIYLQKFLNDV
ncbi:MAG: DNA-3-methyladenine glycosylase 2 family protein [Candidatus Aenigmarchaeota archaeon]|nr:DNA-3-methyladenine glycosylase 2 family protein [Candidatus Aenigmarchaeota archaeon]